MIPRTMWPMTPRPSSPLTSRPARYPAIAPRTIHARRLIAVLHLPAPASCRGPQINSRNCRGAARRGEQRCSSMGLQPTDSRSSERVGAFVLRRPLTTSVVLPLRPIAGAPSQGLSGARASLSDARFWLLHAVRPGRHNAGLAGPSERNRAAIERLTGRARSHSREPYFRCHNGPRVRRKKHRTEGSPGEWSTGHVVRRSESRYRDDRTADPSGLNGRRHVSTPPDGGLEPDRSRQSHGASQRPANRGAEVVDQRDPAPAVRPLARRNRTPELLSPTPAPAGAEGTAPPVSVSGGKRQLE